MRVVRRIRPVWTPLVLSLVVVATLLAVETAGDVFLADELERLFIWMMLVLGLQIFSGNSGVISFGQVAFMAAGAYFSALLTIPPAVKDFTFADMPGYLSSWIFPAELSPLAGTLAGAAIGAVLAAIFGVLIARLEGVGAAIATLAILVIANVFITQTPSVTLGTDVITGVPQTSTLRGTAVWLVIIIFAAYAFQQSRHGLRLRASRENEDAARSVAVHVRRERYLAFVLSGFVYGLAGALFAHYFIGFGYADFYLGLTFIIIAMLVVGGMTSVTGAVVGTYFLSVIFLVVQRIEVDGVFGTTAPSGSANLVVAIALLVALIVWPKGITGGREVPWPARWSRRGGVRQAGAAPPRAAVPDGAGKAAPLD